MNYFIDVDALEDYAKYLKNYKSRTEAARRDTAAKVTKAHENWDDNNYALTLEAMSEINRQTDKLIDELDKAVKTVRKLADGGNDYLRRRR